MTFKKITGKLHLWLGLSSGLIVFIVAITGCLLVFEREIKSLQSFRHAEEQPEKEVLPPSVLRAKAEKVLPEARFAEATFVGVTYNEAGRSAGVGFYDLDPEYYYMVYMNPYTGEVLKVNDEEVDFFHLVLHGHYNLWLPEDIGKPVVATATLIFAIMLISGLVLWWPKNKGAAKQRFSIKWNAQWRRKNYDLHSVLGFYAMSIGFVFALTGLVWGFQWFSDAVYQATGGTASTEYIVPPSAKAPERLAFTPVIAVDKVWQKLNATNTSMYIAYPSTAAGSIYVYVNHQPGTYYKSDYHYFDQYTLAEIPVDGPYGGTYAEAGFADTLRRMNYDIHVGSILGLPGKILAFFASLIIASLPITGTVIWWGRRKKARQAAGSRKSATLSSTHSAAKRTSYRPRPVMKD